MTLEEALDRALLARGYQTYPPNTDLHPTELRFWQKRVGEFFLNATLHRVSLPPPHRQFEAWTLSLYADDKVTEAPARTEVYNLDSEDIEQIEYLERRLLENGRMWTGMTKFIYHATQAQPEHGSAEASVIVAGSEAEAYAQFLDPERWSLRRIGRADEVEDGSLAVQFPDPIV